MKQLPVALHPRHSTMKQRAAAILGRPPVLGMEAAQMLRDLWSRVSAELGDAQAGANKVDNNTRLLNRNQLTREVADGERLGEFRERVAIRDMSAQLNPTHQKRKLTY